MKFKGAVIGLLIAIFTSCIFTSYFLISEVQKQTELQIMQTKIAIVTARNNVPADTYEERSIINVQKDLLKLVGDKGQINGNLN